LVFWQLDKQRNQAQIIKVYIKRKQADCRVMDVTGFPVLLDGENQSSGFPLHILALGISSGSIEILGFNEQTRQTSLLSSVSLHFGPLLCVNHVIAQNDCSQHTYMVSASTDGQILLWSLERFKTM
jgi:hypothetical protein